MRVPVAIFLATVMSSALYAQEDTALETGLQALAQAHHGNVTLFAHDLNSGKTVAIHPDTPVPTASVQEPVPTPPVPSATPVPTASAPEPVPTPPAGQPTASPRRNCPETPPVYTPDCPPVPSATPTAAR